jgi:gliding motility-associated-like protein
MKYIFYIIIFSLLHINIFSQNPNISGIINTYAWGIKTISQTQIQVDNVAGFAINDTILIIQMKGAQINTNNSINFGTVTNFNNVGNYEFSIISNININTNTLFLSCPLVLNYADSLFQVVKLKTYFNATVNNTLTCLPWDGRKGGILALYVHGTLTLNSNIDVSERGFRGFQNLNQNTLNQCSSVIDSNNFYYSISAKDSSGLKGEGIAVTLPIYARGRGKIANGGGGGNALNSGGGGGSNGGEGGAGGKETLPCNSAVGGIGGENLITSSMYNGSRLFMGGGGGCGTFEYNINDASKGGNGGGIVILFANNVISNNANIMANGESILHTTNEESAGGGGGGGTILFVVNNLQGNISFFARGGNGGASSLITCRGSGGGGGGGVLYYNNYSGSITPVFNVSGGLAGNACPGYKGSDGNNGMINNSFTFNFGCLQNNVNHIQANQAICHGQIPQLLTGTTSLQYINYQWQFSYDNNNWSNCPGNSNQPNYQPSALTQTTFFRRVVTLIGGVISVSNTVTITVNNYSLAINKNDVTCYGLCNGNATVSVTPYSPQLTYIWSNGQTTQTINNLCANVYSVTVTDTIGCAAVASVSINQPSQLTVTANIQNPTCIYTCNGSIYFIAQGGTHPYVYNTLNNQNPLINLCPGNYSVTVVDNNQCTTQLNVALTPLTIIQNNIISNNNQNICRNDSITITGSNPTGSGMFNFLWQTSLDGMIWSNAPPINYHPYYNWIADQSRYFKRVVTGGGCSDTSNVLFFNVVQINNQIETADTLYCSYDTILPITGTHDVSYNYIWEYNQGTGWSILSTQNMYYLTPISNIQFASYRRIVNFNGCYDTSNVINIYMISAPSANRIYIDNTDTIKQYCQFAEGNLIGQILSPVDFIIWQYSTDSVNWANITGNTPSFYFSLNDYSIRYHYYRRILTYQGCYDTSNVVTIDLLPPVLNIIESSSGLQQNIYVCQGSMLAIGSFINQPSGGNNQFTYLWIYRTDTISPWTQAPGTNNQKNYIILFVSDTMYFARIIYSGSCTDTSNVLSIYPIILPPNEIYTNQTQYCNGDTIYPIIESQSTQGFNVNYQWQMFNNNQWINIPGATQNSYTPTYNAGTISYRRIISINNCTSISNIIDIIGSTITTAALHLESNDSICFIPNVTANIRLNLEGTPPWNITFSINGNNYNVIQYQNDSIYSFELQLSQNIITITNIQSSNQCSTIVNPDTIIIWTFQHVSAHSLSSETCGLTTTLKATSPSEGIGTWYVPNDITISNIHSPVAEVQSNNYGTYTFIWEVKNGPCIDTNHTIVTFYQQPSQPDAGTDVLIYDNNAQIMLNASQPTVGQGTWSVVQGQAIFSNIHQHNSSVTNLAEGENILRWTVTNGVCQPVFDDVIIKLYSIIVPEGFSPNGDGYNDLFVIKGIDENISLHLLIFNRWGEIVYESTSYKNNWDGKNINGQHLPDDTYFYILNRDNKLIKSGYLILKR